MTRAYVDTTVLTNVLLKPGSDLCASAQAALMRYDSSLLPVYAIKEWKAGPLEHYAYLHDKLFLTKSLSATVEAIHKLHRSPYKRSTSEEALVAAIRLDAAGPNRVQSSKDRDSEAAERYRLALASLILRSWRKRRHVATETIQDLDCYTETAPRLDTKGLFSLSPKKCDRDQECSLAIALKSRPDLLRRLRDPIPEDSIREEDRKRRKALKQLISHPEAPVSRETCRHLGDAIFAFFCPDDAIILTTNERDHAPLASALGKRVEKP